MPPNKTNKQTTTTTTTLDQRFTIPQNVTPTMPMPLGSEQSAVLSLNPAERKLVKNENIINGSASPTTSFYQIITLSRQHLYQKITLPDPSAMALA